MEKKFRIISVIFLIGCIIFYGARFGYYYMKFNKNSSDNSGSEVLSSSIKNDNKIVSKGDGLYNNNGELVFKGKNVNNYLVYSGITWRIIKINTDNSIVLITDDKLTNLAYDKTNTSYIKSNIGEWLNETEKNTGIFESKLYDKHKYLIPNTICLDNVSNLNNITCHKKDITKYISMINVADYLNSKNSDSYINNTDSIWTINSKDNTKVWYINNGNVSNDSVTNIHGVKAVVTLKNTIGKTKGKGTKEEPYFIDENKEISFNNFVKLGNDLYKVYDIENDTIKLVNTNLVNDLQKRYVGYNSTEFNPKSNNSVANYLNYTIYNKLPYKEKLIDCNYYVGDYNTDYKDIYNKKVTTKIGELSIADINIDDVNTNYFLLNKHDNIVSSINDGKSTTIDKVKYTICINKNNKFKGNGTKNKPFELEG